MRLPKPWAELSPLQQATAIHLWHVDKDLDEPVCRMCWEERQWEQRLPSHDLRKAPR